MVRLKTSFLGAILSVACVLALPDIKGPAPDPRAIPLSKHNDILAKRPDGKFPGVERFQAQIARTKAKIQRGLSAIESNTGRIHPATAGFKAGFSPLQKRAPLPKFVPSQNQKRQSVSLTDLDDGLWYGNITVGTLGKTFPVGIDTGSSDMWLFAAGCDDTCDGHTLWNTSASVTARNTTVPFFLEYNAGDVTGFIFNDTVTIGGLKAATQAVGAANHSTVGFTEDEFPPSGLVGLAFPSLSQYEGQPSPLFTTLVKQGTIAPAFGVRLAETGSELFLGGANHALYKGDFRNVSVIEKDYYEVGLQALVINDELVLLTEGMTAIVDTGTPLIIGPPDTVEDLYTLIPGAANASEFLGPGYWTVPCDSFPTISFFLGASELFDVAPSILNLGVFLGNECVSGLISQEGVPFWVLGDIFLRNFYTVFDQGNALVGFATPV